MHMLVLHFMAYYDTSYLHLKLNLIITQLEYIVDQVMVPLNRVFPSATTFAFMGRLCSVRCHASGRCLQQGKVMGVRYAGPVSRHNLVCMLLRLWYRVPVWDVYVLATMVVVVSLVDTGPPRTSPVSIVTEWPGECHGNGGVSSEYHWPTRMGVRGHGFRGVGTVCYLCRV